MILSDSPRTLEVNHTYHQCRLGSIDKTNDGT